MSDPLDHDWKLPVLLPVTENDPLTDLPIVTQHPVSLLIEQQSASSPQEEKLPEIPQEISRPPSPTIQIDPNATTITANPEPASSVAELELSAIRAVHREIDNEIFRQFAIPKSYFDLAKTGFGSGLIGGTFNDEFDKKPIKIGHVKEWKIIAPKNDEDDMEKLDHIQVNKGRDAKKEFQAQKMLHEAASKRMMARNLPIAIPDHDHNQDDVWITKWNDTYRICKHCGLKQWKLQCWTKHRWAYKAPVDRIQSVREDITDKVNEGLNELWIEKPHRIRSLDVIPEAILDTQITVIGAGSIGSFTVMCLNKMGFERIAVYDPDVVGVENTGTQLYGAYWANERSLSKASALSEILMNIGPTGKPIEAHNRSYPRSGFSNDIYGGGVVISAVDSMKSRKEIWDAVKDQKKITAFIDARMGAEQALMYTMKPCEAQDRKDYERTLYTDEEAIKEPCTRRATVYTAFLIAGMIGKSVKDVLSNSRYARIMMWNIADNVQQIFHNS